MLSIILVHVIGFGCSLVCVGWRPRYLDAIEHRIEHLEFRDRVTVRRLQAIEGRIPETALRPRTP